MIDQSANNSTEYMITTVDNPFNPFTQFDEWLSFDTHAGYFTPGLLARIVINSDDLSEADQNKAVQDAIDEVVTENVLGLYKKVSRSSFQNVSQD